MLTGDTITDEQIRKLADDAEYALRFEGDRTKVLADTYAALNTDPWIQAKRPNERAAARARCAETSTQGRAVACDRTVQRAGSSLRRPLYQAEGSSRRAPARERDRRYFGLAWRSFERSRSARL